VSVYEHIRCEAQEQLNEEGRPLTRFILTPADWDALEVEMKACASLGCINYTAGQITLHFPSGPVGVIKGPP
jgi:hypothetical protein